MQGDKVRSLKSSGVAKKVWQPEVAVLLELKKKLAAASGNPVSGASKKGNKNTSQKQETKPAVNSAPSANHVSLDDPKVKALEQQIEKQVLYSVLFVLLISTCQTFHSVTFVILIEAER